MGTTLQLKKIRGGHDIAQEEIDPAALWLDQDVSGEELVELDPLEETEDLLVLAEEGLGERHLVEKVQSYSQSLWETVWGVLKAQLQEEHGGTESFGEFRARLQERA